MPKKMAFLDRGIFLIILGILWVLYERGNIENLVQLVGTLLVMFGISVVLISVFSMLAKEEVAA